MQRQRGELVPVAETLADLPGPVKASREASPQALHHFTQADTSDFAGSVRCTAPGEGMFTGVAVEFDAGSRIFTTLPVVPVQR